VELYREELMLLPAADREIEEDERAEPDPLLRRSLDALLASRFRGISAAAETPGPG
jgi:hypothetical protein